MDISDAFHPSEVDASGVQQTEEELADLRTWLGEALDAMTVETKVTEETVVDFGAMAFLAGRVYQTQFEHEGMTVNMSHHMARMFMEFLASQIEIGE